MMRSRTLILSLVMLMVFGASVLVAQQRGRAVMPGSAPQMGNPEIDGRGPLGPIGRCLGALGLTEAQKADIRALAEAEVPVLQALHETVKTDEEALKALLEGASPEPCGVGTAFLKVHADRDAIRTELQAFRAKIEALLTAEQKLRLAGCIDGQQGPRP